MSFLLRTVVVVAFAVLMATAFTQELEPIETPAADPSDAGESLESSELGAAPEESSEPEAVPKEQRDGELTIGQSESVILDATNGIDGAIGILRRDRRHLRPSTALRVELYDSESRRIRSVTTDRRGRFRFDDLSGGMYQLVAKGENGFLAISLMVIEGGLTPADDLGQRGDRLFLVQVPTDTKEEIDILRAAVPPTFRQLNSILRLHYGLSVPTYMLPGRFAPEVNSEPEQAETTIDTNSPSARKAADRYEVRLLEGDRIRGRLYTLDPNTGAPRTVSNVYVHIIRDDQPVGPPILVNRQGEFVAELPAGPGAYSIVAAGQDGFGAAGFYALPREEIEALHERGEPTFLVSTELAQVQALPQLGQGNQELNLALVSPAVIRSAMPAVGGAAGGVAPPIALPAPPVTTVASGGRGRGGGLGALLVGSGIVGAVALTVNDDDDRRQASPFSPF